VPLRFPRPTLVAAATGLAVASVALLSSPARADQVRRDEWWLSELDITQAQQVTKGSGVTVAVLDSGVDPDQSDLTGSVITGPDYTNSGRTLGGPFFGVHGTEMASLIAGHGHGPGDADGIIGVAPEAKILSVRVTLDPGDPLFADPGITANLPDAIAAGIRFAVRNGAQVIDLPLDPGQASASGAAGAADAAGGSAAERSAVSAAIRDGVVLVAPAGDDGEAGDAANFPAAYPGVISVGAVDRSFIREPFSSDQSYVTLTAAGEDVTAAEPPDSYTAVDSTSAASAIVAGIAALIKAQDPILTPAQVATALTTSAQHQPPPSAVVDGAGAGAADAARALTAAAALAKPRTARAGAGSNAHRLPAVPAPSAAPQSLTPVLERDGLISLAVLVLLLLPVTAYAARRRRRTAATAARANGLSPSRTRAMQAGLPGRGDWEVPSDPEVRVAAGGTAADRMLEYFAAPASTGTDLDGGSGAAGYRTGSSGLGGSSTWTRRVGPAAGDVGSGDGGGLGSGGFVPGGGPGSGGFVPGGGPGGFGPGGGPRSGGGFGPGGGPGSGGGFAQGGGPGGFGQGGGPGSGGGFAQGGGPGGPGPGGLGPGGLGPGGPGPGGRGPGRAARPALMPVPRPPTFRPPQVSGAPPWEPAEKPDSELPWMTAPAPASSAFSTRRPRSRHAAPPQPAAAPVADSDNPYQVAREPEPGWVGEPIDIPAAEAEGGPIYVWNPDDATDTLPAVRGDRDGS
jgi:Subtilase family